LTFENVILYCPKVSLKERGKHSHKTIKPIRLMEFLVKLVTSRDDIILDPFMGSGSTGIGCRRQSIDFYGIEKEVDIFKQTKVRINDLMYYDNEECVKDNSRFEKIIDMIETTKYNCFSLVEKPVDLLEYFKSF